MLLGCEVHGIHDESAIIIDTGLLRMEGACLPAFLTMRMQTCIRHSVCMSVSSRRVCCVGCAFVLSVVHRRYAPGLR